MILKRETCCSVLFFINLREKHIYIKPVPHSIGAILQLPRWSNPTVGSDRSTETSDTGFNRMNPTISTKNLSDPTTFSSDSLQSDSVPDSIRSGADRFRQETPIRYDRISPEPMTRPYRWSPANNVILSETTPLYQMCHDFFHEFCITISFPTQNAIVCPIDLGFQCLSHHKKRIAIREN